MEETEEKKFYRSFVYAIQDGYLFTLIKKLNEFYEGKWVVATQVFPPEQNHSDKWSAIVYYKEAIKKK